MIMAYGRCDAEIGKVPNWRRCDKKAKWEIARSMGGTMEYCEKHKGRSQDPRYMRKRFGA